MLKRLKRFLAAMFAPNPYKLTNDQLRGRRIKAQQFDHCRNAVAEPMATRNSPRRVNSGLGVRSAADAASTTVLPMGDPDSKPKWGANISGHDSHDSGSSDHSSSNNHSSQGE